jgi:DNA primase
MEGFPRNAYLYNYAAAKATDLPFIFLVEGPADVLRLAEAGFVGVALLGCDASPHQLAKLAALGKEVWVSFDNDDAGRDARGRFFKKLGSSGVHFPVQTFTAPSPHKDLGDATAEEIRRSVVATMGAEMPES